MQEKDFETFYPKDRKQWRNWLSKNHLSKQSVWVIFYKKKSKIASISWEEAVEEALCFGWIDSKKKTIDEVSYMQYYCKRKHKSNWSKINKIKVDQLEVKGLMTKAGWEIVEIAKQNGSWTLLDSVEALMIPDDLKSNLIKTPPSFSFYSSQSNSTKKRVLFWLISAKRSETRQKRIDAITQYCIEGKFPVQF